MPLSLEVAAQGFAAMGSESRLQVLLCLVRAGEEGLLVGEIGERLDMPASTLAHHLKFLTAAGIVAQQKVGRSTINKACLNELAELGQYIMAECCQDQLTSHQHKAANDG